MSGSELSTTLKSIWQVVDGRVDEVRALRCNLIWVYKLWFVRDSWVARVDPTSKVLWGEAGVVWRKSTIFAHSWLSRLRFLIAVIWALLVVWEISNILHSLGKEHLLDCYTVLEVADKLEDQANKEVPVSEVVSHFNDGSIFSSVGTLKQFEDYWPWGEYNREQDCRQETEKVSTLEVVLINDPVVDIDLGHLENYGDEKDDYFTDHKKTPIHVDVITDESILLVCVSVAVCYT